MPTPLTTENIYALLSLFLVVIISWLIWQVLSLRRQLREINRACNIINEMKNEEYLSHQEERRDWEQYGEQQHALILEWQDKAGKRAREVETLKTQLAEMDSESSFDKLLEELIAVCKKKGHPFTINDLWACALAYHSLKARIGSGTATLFLFDLLVVESSRYERPWGWLAAELQFEERALQIGRQEAMNEDIALSNDPGSSANLDLYMKRKIRFDKSASTPTK